MRFSARILTVVIGFSLLFSSLVTPTFAQTTNTNLTTSTATTSINIPVLTQQVLMGFLSTATCVVGGVDFLSQNHSCLSYNSKTGSFDYTKNTSGGLLGLAAGGVALTFTPPFHTSDYLQYLSDSWIVKKADAANAGVGFDELSPITNLWIGFRNLAYLLFVIIFVVIGFAIMLRAKIDPRTVMTIENQIPKLIIALILITFSFAIAGFVLDIMWVAIYLVINIFASLDPVLAHQVGQLTANVQDNPFGWVNDLNSGFGGFLGIAGQAAGGVKDIAKTTILGVVNQQPWLTFIFFLTNIPADLACIFTHLSPFDWGKIPGCISDTTATIEATIIAGVTFLIFAIALLVVIARVWWILIKSYSLFLVFAIFGPIAIMSGVLPGSKTNFEYWIRHLLAYTIVFPTVMGLFLLGKTLMDVYIAHGTTAPPLWGIPGAGNASGQIVAFIGPLVGFAVMMMAPQALTMVQDALNAPDPKYLAGIGQAISGGAQPFVSGGSNVWKRWTRERDMFHDEGALRSLFLGPASKTNMWRQFWVGRETNLFPGGKSGS